jgi:small conductance mechanosensitive channel
MVLAFAQTKEDTLMPDWEQYVSIEKLYTVGADVLRVGVILVATYIATKVLRRWLPRFARSITSRLTTRSGESSTERDKRAETLSGIFVAGLVVTTWTVGLLMALKQAGFDVGPVLAGAGVVGLAVGFGAQNLVRDVITGALILLENQIRVGDVAIVNGTGGLVERINLRTVTLRGLDGVVHVFPNGKIDSLSNMTHDFSYYVFDIGVAYKEDTDRVVEVLREIADGMIKDEAYKSDIVEPLEVLGVDAFADSAVMIKARIKTRPIKQWRVGREMNRRIKKTFDEQGIEIPFPHRSIYFGEASKPIALVQEDQDRAELKRLIGEVMAEQLSQAAQRSPQTISPQAHG